MLLMYCCAETNCGQVFVRTDERKESVLDKCPNCGGKTFFKCDFRTWTGGEEWGNDASIDRMSRYLKLLRDKNVTEKSKLRKEKQKMYVYHNELWRILKNYEPEKYKTYSPV